jgi:hypothetical protein
MAFHPQVISYEFPPSSLLISAIIVRYQQMTYSTIMEIYIKQINVCVVGVSYLKHVGRTQSTICLSIHVDINPA